MTAALNTEPAPDIVRDLLRPEAYAPPRPKVVELRTTHCSWVFLTGDEVFKVKRPVNLGFLDFRALEARRHSCEEELRLNRRLAPDVYLGVEPVRLTATGCGFGGSGPIVDWAVHMRRLPDDASTEALLAAGTLRPERLETLAHTLAAFFKQARPTPEHGTPAALRRNIEENLAQTTSFAAAGDLVDARTLEEIWRFQDEELAFHHVDRFAARVGAGWIREGHGDLRLEHVYFVRDAFGVERPLAIDCVEFNDRFRCGDVAGEIAFLAMDLEAAGRPDLAAGFVARSAEALGDFDLYGVLDFYLCYRAWVRAKVAGFVASDASVGWDVRARKHAEARHDFKLARACAGRPLAAPALVAVGGIIGSGKSTLAAALGRGLAAPVVSSDRTRKALAGLAATDRGGPELYTAEATEQTYAELMRRASVVLDSGRTVILDATFSEQRWRVLAAELARAFGTAFAFVEASCPDWQVLRERLRWRQGNMSESDADEALLDQIAARPGPPCLWPEGERIVIDTRAPIAEVTRTALKALSAQGIVAPDGPGRFAQN
jgi:aminoglycoside phosphotransferase family enzyme/predicted kinase